MDCRWKPTLQQIVNIQLAIYLWKNVDLSEAVYKEKSINKNYKLDADLSTLTEVIAKLPLPPLHRRELVEICRPIGMHILTWLEYHISLFNDRVIFVNEFVQKLVWNSEGFSINQEETAICLINGNILSPVDKYQLACIYCLDQYICSLWDQVKHEKIFSDLQCLGAPQIPVLVKHRSYCMVSNLSHCDCLDHSLRNILQVDFELPFGDGFLIGLWTKNLIAIKYFWNRLKTQLGEDNRRKLLVNSAVYIAKQRYNLSYSPPFNFSSEYCAPILLFLLSEMDKNQQIETFMKDITTAEWSSGVLRCFLDWPYQIFFMQSARCIGLLLPVSQYTRLLLTIVEKMTYEIDYDYRLLFTELWKQNFSLNNSLTVQEIGELLINLFFVDDFNGNDLESIRIVLENVRPHERQKMLKDFKGRCICFALVRRQKWDLLEMLIKSCLLSSQENEKDLKKKLFLEIGEEICQALIVNERNWELISEFMTWSCLCESEKEIMMTNLQRYELNYIKMREDNRRDNGRGRRRRHRRRRGLSNPQRRSGSSLSSLVRWCHPLPKPLDKWKMLCFVAKFITRTNNNNTRS